MSLSSRAGAVDGYVSIAEAHIDSICGGNIEVAHFPKSDFESGI